MRSVCIFKQLQLRLLWFVLCIYVCIAIVAFRRVFALARYKHSLAAGKVKW
jgi:hypothetical protein